MKITVVLDEGQIGFVSGEKLRSMGEKLECEFEENAFQFKEGKYK